MPSPFDPLRPELYLREVVEERVYDRVCGGQLDRQFCGSSRCPHAIQHPYM